HDALQRRGADQGHQAARGQREEGQQHHEHEERADCVVHRGSWKTIAKAVNKEPDTSSFGTCSRRRRAIVDSTVPSSTAVPIALATNKSQSGHALGENGSKAP